MARKKRKETNDKQLDRMFEKQQRRLNRKWFINAVSAIILLAAILAALQFTPYRNIHLELIEAARSLVKSLSSGSSAPSEADPKYW